MDNSNNIKPNKIFPPFRGFIFHSNSLNEVVPLEDLKKWIRVQKEHFKVDKIDFLSDIDDDYQTLTNLLSFTEKEVSCKLSWGTSILEPPVAIENLKEQGILDIFLITTNHTTEQIKKWIDTCHHLDIPLRIYCSLPSLFNQQISPETIIETFKQADSITFIEKYPFLKQNTHPKLNKENLQSLNKILYELKSAGTPTSIIGFPFCLFDSPVYSSIINMSQFYTDSEFYNQSAFEFAQTLWRLRTYKIRKILETKLRQKTSFHSGIDFLVLPWILNHPGLYVPLWAWHKLTRHIKWRKNYQTLPENISQIEYQIRKKQEEKEKEEGICSTCSLKHICDKGKNPFNTFRFDPHPISGNVIRDPLYFRKQAPHYSDRLDIENKDKYAALQRLYDEAFRVVLHEKPWKEISSEDYKIENRMTHYMSGAIRWFSFNCGELESTSLCRTQPPLTISVTFGGGFAEQIGFSFGPHIKIVCPMIAQSHRLILHIDENGNYVLIRDNEQIFPTEFIDISLVPSRLPDVLEPRISIWNIDGEIVTQGITLWKPEDKEKPIPETKPKFSILYVCSRYANRLKASLLSIAQQKQFDLSQIEIVVAYVPGLDATDDILDCFEYAFPDIKIVRSPFNQSFWKSKGTLINASLPLCSGDWIVLLDADIILHPDFFSSIDKVGPDTYFVAPDGRKMLTPETTSKIILGLIQPWEHFDELLNGPGEWRRRESDGIPIGYCQCCRKEVFEKISYPEFEHFEGADWFFGRSVLETFGPEYRLEGIPVLHLDHGGSQWYGSQKHR